MRHRHDISKIDTAFLLTDCHDKNERTRDFVRKPRIPLPDYLVTAMKPKPTSRPSQRIERTQQALLDAIVELIAEKGYDRTTIKNVLRRADVGRTTFYSHFKSKKELLLRRIEVVPWVTAGQDNERMFDASFLFTHISEQRALVAGLEGTSGYDEALASLRRSLLANFSQVLQERSPTDEVGNNLHMTSQALTGALMQLLQWWLESGMPETPRAMASWFSHLADRIVAVD